MTKPDRLLITLGNIHKNVYGPNKKWDCIVDGCNEPAIVSHLLQRNGILNFVEEEGHMILVQTTEPYSWKNQKLPVEFKRVGIRGSISIPLFCDTHDTELFREIELLDERQGRTPLDPHNYRCQLLLSLRTMYAEKRRKQQAAEINKRISLANTIPYDIKEESKNQLKLQMVGIRNLDIYIKDCQSCHRLKVYSNSPFMSMMS